MTKRTYFDVMELMADRFNIIAEYGKKPRITAKLENGKFIYTATF